MLARDFAEVELFYYELLQTVTVASIVFVIDVTEKFEFGACSIWIVEDVGRGSFLFPTYLGRSKETLFAGYSENGSSQARKSLWLQITHSDWSNLVTHITWLPVNILRGFRSFGLHGDFKQKFNFIIRPDKGVNLALRIFLWFLGWFCHNPSNKIQNHNTEQDANFARFTMHVPTIPRVVLGTGVNPDTCRIRVDGQIRFESGYVWTYPERKRCGVKNIRIREDGAWMMVRLFLFLYGRAYTRNLRNS